MTIAEKVTNHIKEAWTNDEGKIEIDNNNIDNLVKDVMSNIEYYSKNTGTIDAKVLSVGNLNDMVNHPQHYIQSKYECIDVIEEITKPCSKFEAYIIGTVLKYIWRFKYKNGLEDLKKARWYLDRLISKEEEENK